MLRTFLFFLIFPPLTLFVILTGLPLSFISPDYFHNYARRWGRAGLWISGVRLDVDGLDRIPPERPVIFMPNHQSNFDIPALFAAIPGQFRWLAKEELFRIPLFGLAMRRCGYIPIDRSGSRKSLRSIKDAALRISGGASVIVFPEGTRSPDGRLHSFKKGGFLLARYAGVPVVPVVIRGTWDIMPRNTLKIRGGRIHVQLLSPIFPEGKSPNEERGLMERVYRDLSEALGSLDAAPCP